ncbi:MAG: hypothetical protein AABY22_12505 [Nanoarchaeota archaeon]
MIIYIEKLFNYKGKTYCDVRDYLARECMKKKQDIRVVYKGEYIDIPANKIWRTKKLITKEKIQSIYYPSQKYSLWSYEWENPKRVPEYKVIN